MGIKLDSIVGLLNEGSSSAFLNLFDISIYQNDPVQDQLLIARSRLSAFSIPEKKINTVELPYQNIQLPVLIPSVELSRHQTFTLRIDENYEEYLKIRNLIPFNFQGDTLNNEEDPSNKYTYTIKVSSYKMEEDLKEVYSWVFHDCKFVSIGSFTYEYSSSSPVSCQVSFIYSSLDEIKAE